MQKEIWDSRVLSGLEAVTLLFFPIMVAAPLGMTALVSVAAVMALALLILRQSATAIVRTPFAWLFGLLALWAAASISWTISQRLSVTETSRIAVLSFAGLALTTLVQRLSANEAKRLADRFVLGIAISVGMLLLVAAAVRLGLLPENLFLPRFNSATMVLSIAGAPAVAHFWYEGRRGDARNLSLMGAFAILSLYGSTAKLAVAIVPVAMAIFWLAPRALSRFAAIFAALAIVTAPLTFTHLTESPAIAKTLGTVKFSAWHRAEIWGFVGTKIEERPLLGWGMNAARVVPGAEGEFEPGAQHLPLHPHNAALQLWLELGAPGALLGAVLAFLLWWKTYDPALPRAVSAARAAAMTAAMLGLLDTYGIWQEWWEASLWFVAAMAIAQKSAR
jgi:O-antigen ligase